MGSSSNPNSPEKPESGRSLEKRENEIVVGSGETLSGKVADDLSTIGMATCYGVAVTFDHHNPSQPNKVLSQIMPSESPDQLNKFHNVVKSIWEATNRAKPTYRISIPDHGSMVQEMVNDGTIPQSRAQDFLKTMVQGETQIVGWVDGVSSLTNGRLSTKKRAPGMLGSPHGELVIRPGNTVVHEGLTWS